MEPASRAGFVRFRRAARFTKGVFSGQRKRVEEWRAGAHPFFWLLCVLLVPAIAAAASAPSKAPGYALNSAWVYRLEVGGAFYLGLFVLTLILWLGYSGRSLGELQIPGGGGARLPPPDPDLDDAAEGLAGYKQKTDHRLEKLEENIELLLTDDGPAS